MAWKHNGMLWYKSKVVWAMITVAMVESTFLFLQAAKVFETGSADDLSLTAFSIFLTTSLLWIIWGILTKDIPVLVAGSLSTIGTALVIVSIFVYGSDSGSSSLRKNIRAMHKARMILRS
jgi:MtN3 and saliva related transmembrane protein